MIFSQLYDPDILLLKDLLKTVVLYHKIIICEKARHRLLLKLNGGLHIFSIREKHQNPKEFMYVSVIF